MVDLVGVVDVERNKGWDGPDEYAVCAKDNGNELQEVDDEVVG